MRPLARTGHQARGRMARVSRAQLSGGGTVLPGRHRRPPRSAAGARGRGEPRQLARARARPARARRGGVGDRGTGRRARDRSRGRRPRRASRSHGHGLWFDALSLGPLFDVGAWDELLQVADDVLRRSREAGGDYAAGLAQPWLTQVLLWRGRPRRGRRRGGGIDVRSAHIRDAQVLVPAEVAAALVAVREGRGQDAIRIVEELEREIGGLAGLVPRELPRGPRPGLRRDRRRAARAAADRRREGHRATTRPVPALGQGRDGGGARAPRCRDRAVRAGRRGLDRVRPPARDRDRAARCEPLPRRSRRPGSARPRPAGRGDLHRAGGRLARSTGTPGGTRR